MSGLEVMARRCDQCLFSKNKIVSDARQDDLLNKCAREDRYFVCHKASIAKREVACRGFYDTRTTNLTRIAQRLGCVEFVEEEKLSK